MKKTAIAVGLMLALGSVAVTAQTAAPAAVKTTAAAAPATSDFCKITVTKATKAKPGAKFKRAKAKRPGKAVKRVGHKPQLDVCDSPAQPMAQQGAGKGAGAGNGAGAGTGAAGNGAPIAIGGGQPNQQQMAAGDKLPEGDLTKILEPTAAGPAAAGAPGAFAVPTVAPAAFTSAPSFGSGGGGVGVATRN